MRRPLAVPADGLSGCATVDEVGPHDGRQREFGVVLLSGAASAGCVSGVTA